ncbi:MAG: type II secretion system F family protein [Acidimicrobiia bacterium]
MATAIATFLGKHWIALALGIALSVIVAGPLLTLAASGAIVIIVAWRKALAKKARTGIDAESELLAVDVTSLASASGLPFISAVSLAGREAGGAVAIDIAQALRRTGSGLRAEPNSEAIRKIFVEAEKSSTTGGPLGPGLSALAMTMRADRAAAAQERLNRLPVKLLFPLAFLTLPGFVLLTVGPAVVGGLSRISL